MLSEGDCLRYIPYFDAHCDALHYCMEHGEALHSHSGQCDLRRLSGYRPWGQMFAIYQDSARCAPEELPRWMSVGCYLFALVMVCGIVWNTFGAGMVPTGLFFCLLGTLYYGILVIRDELRRR